MYSIFARIFQNFFNNHAPIKQEKEETMLTLRLKISVTQETLLAIKGNGNLVGYEECKKTSVTI